MPDDEPTVALLTSLLIHVPPGVELVNGRVEFSQTDEDGPIMAVGGGLTVTEMQLAQPDEDV